MERQPSVDRKAAQTAPSAAPTPADRLPATGPVWHAPYLRAPEASRSIFHVLLISACAPLAAGAVFFGWRGLAVAAVCVGACMVFERAYYRLTRTPALLGQSHGALTGLLLALTLPAFVPWYVPVVGSFFAVIVGKALFGGVGHFLWQPALVGRLAVAVIFGTLLTPTLPDARTGTGQERWPILTQQTVLFGDVTRTGQAVATDAYPGWRSATPPAGGDAVAIAPPANVLDELTEGEQPAESISMVLRRLPPAWDMFVGARPGGIGETCIIAILVAGLYLVYRNYVLGVLPGMFILGAALAAAVLPVRVGAEGHWQWLPLAAEGLDVGVVYVAYTLITGELMLAAWFFATEMTSRPVTVPAQAIFGLLCGITAILLRLYLVPLAHLVLPSLGVASFPIPAYGAVLLINTFTPLLDGIRPRPLGRKRWWQRLGRRKEPGTGS